MPLLELLRKKYAVLWAEALARHSPWTLRLGCCVMTLAIFALDYSLGQEFTLGLFYSIPISILAWFVGPYSGFAVSVLAVGLLETGEYSGHIIWVPLVNGFFRLVFYAFFVFVLARLSSLQRNLVVLAEDRAVALAREAAKSLRLEREVLEIGEREQRRIGQDLHDGLCQHLTGTALASQVLVENLSSNGLTQADSARRLVELIEGGITLTRGIAKGLYPIEMQSDGLMQALELFAVQTSSMFGMNCRFSCPLPVLIDAPTTAAHLYRIAQEAVSNAIRHGSASEIEISLDESDSGIRLGIRDNGTGMPEPIAGHDGMGLRTMTDRAHSIGGSFSIHPGMLGGAEVICIAPGRLLI